MSQTDPGHGQARYYYDPDEVEAYIAEATKTITDLQARLAEALQRGEAAREPGDSEADTASLGRALLLASEVADKTLSDADAKAAEIVAAAEARARAIIGDAEAESQRIVDQAREAASGVFDQSEARLLAAVAAFVEGSDHLRNELEKVKVDAMAWRTPSPPSGPSPFFRPPPPPPAAAPLLVSPPNSFQVSPIRPPDPQVGGAPWSANGVRSPAPGDGAARTDDAVSPPAPTLRADGWGSADPT